MEAAQAPAATTMESSSSSCCSSSNGGGAERSKGGAGMWRWVCSAPELARFCSAKVAMIAREDPRRVAHSLKVGLALTLVSVVYYVTPLFNGFGGSSAMWAVLTVVIVMEFTVGIFTYLFTCTFTLKIDRSNLSFVRRTIIYILYYNILCTYVQLIY